MPRPSTVLLAGATLVISAVAALPAPAAASGPAAGCPPPYILFQIPDDGSRPAAAAVDARGNNDGYACEMPLPGESAEHVGALYNVIDNRVPGAQ